MRSCDWCGAEMITQRRDAVCCSTRCRQARHRFMRGTGTLATADRPLRLAYADPPYPGQAGIYREHPDYAGEVDHQELVMRLASYDGWALSTSAKALPEVLAVCPPKVRVAAWVRGERPTRSAWPLNAWEPVIYAGGRQLIEASYLASTTRRIDALVYRPGNRLTDPARVIGSKPPQFAAFVFQLLGARTGDSLDDLFPGSGGIARAWRYATARPS